MSNLSNRIFLIGALLVIIAGGVSLAFGMMIEDTIFTVLGFVIIFLGIVLLATGFTNQAVTVSREGTGLGLLMVVGSIVTIIGTLLFELGFAMVAVLGAVLILLSSVLWPCFCCQGSQGIKSKIVGIASAHDRISVAEIARLSGVDEKIVSDALYKAIGSRELAGKMEGDTFVRAAPTTVSYTGATTTREREVVKVLVICPYCGAKTEQGMAKCQNCGSDL
jgi:hypothetical protein